MINQEEVDAMKRDLLKRTEPDRIKGALTFYSKHQETPLVDVCLNFGLEFQSVYQEIERLRQFFNKTQLKEDKIRKIHLRDHAIAYMRANPHISAYSGARAVGLKTEASVTALLRKEFKAAGGHLVACVTCGRLPPLKSKGRPIDSNSKLAQAYAWKEANPGMSDYEAAMKFGLRQRSALSVYRKRLLKPRCITCEQPF